MFDLKNFYVNYQYDYHVYKVLTLRALLSDVDKFNEEYLKDSIVDFDNTDFERTLKGDLRFTLFHAIETLFELIFCLEPRNDGLEDKDVLIRLSSSNWSNNYRRITKIAEEENAINFLDETVVIANEKITISRYLFYFGMWPNGKLFSKKDLNEIEPSINAIKYSLVQMAKEFISRNEYNCYKHALRIIPALSNLEFINQETKEPILKYDLTDSMTYINPKKDGEIQFVTKTYDTERNIKMTLVCSKLISNIILARKFMFGMSKKEEGFRMSFFTSEEIQKNFKVGVKIQDIIHTIKPRL